MGSGVTVRIEGPAVEWGLPARGACSPGGTCSRQGDPEGRSGGRGCPRSPNRDSGKAPGCPLSAAPPLGRAAGAGGEGLRRAGLPREGRAQPLRQPGELMGMGRGRASLPPGPLGQCQQRQGWRPQAMGEPGDPGGFSQDQGKGEGRGSRKGAVATPAGSPGRPLSCPWSPTDPTGGARPLRRGLGRTCPTVRASPCGGRGQS